MGVSNPKILFILYILLVKPEEKLDFTNHTGAHR